MVVKSGVTLRFIDSGKPTQNAYVENFNGKFRDECLNEYWFLSIKEAREIIEAWRIHYNEVSLHSSLGYLTQRNIWTLPNKGKATSPVASGSLLQRSLNEILS
ncbi:MAG: transposase [Methylocystaceae bacterium]|nr:transposase [Methylocystaceae bacterium]